MTRHHLFDPAGLRPAVGFSYGALAAPGRLLAVAGMTGEKPDGGFDDSIAPQFAVACRNVARVIVQAGGDPGDVVSMTIYTTAMAEYRESLVEIGGFYREVFGRHFPPMALIGVAELFDPAAKIELVCLAVLPEDGESDDPAGSG